MYGQALAACDPEQDQSPQRTEALESFLEYRAAHGLENDVGTATAGELERPYSVIDPEDSVSPSGLNATLVTELVWPVSGWPIGCPVSMFHSRTVLSLLPEANVLPSGLKATLFTPAKLVRDVPRAWPLVTSHRMMVLSRAPEARILPSGLKAMLFTAPSWPVRGSPSG